MDQYALNSTDDHKKLIIVVITFLAAKTEDKEEIIPSIKALANFIDLSGIIDIDRLSQIKNSKNPEDQEYIRSEWIRFSSFYSKLEYTAFQCANFNTICPTVASYIGYYSAYAVDEQDFLEFPGKFQSFGDMKLKAIESINELSGKSLIF